MLEEHTKNQKYINYLQPRNQSLCWLIHTRMRNIDSQWYKRKILDYGCNNAHLLTTSHNAISHSNYIGVDIQKNAIDVASSLYPNAKFVLYDGYHVSFNPSGTKKFPELGPYRPEIIVCHGVFTHCDIITITNTIEYFKSIIEKGGFIIFSLWEDFHLPQYVNLFLKEKLNVIVPQNLLSLEYKVSFYLINRNYAIIDRETLDLKQCDWIETFYRRNYILSKIPNVLIPNGEKSKHTIFVIPT